MTVLTSNPATGFPDLLGAQRLWRYRESLVHDELYPEDLLSFLLCLTSSSCLLR